jgi:acyl-CoA thioester hydrolase
VPSSVAMSLRREAPAGDFRYEHPIEVRFVDTDALGHVNNAVYLSYFEAARAGYYAAVTGAPFGTGEHAAERTFVIAEARVVYRAPAFFCGPVQVGGRLIWTRP